jgi:hypothetical protein
LGENGQWSSLLCSYKLSYVEANPQIHMLGDLEMEIEDLVPAYFQQTLADLREMGGARLPSVFYVSQKEPTDDIGLKAGSILRRWKIDKSDVIEIPEIEPLPELVTRFRGYCDHGEAGFSIFSDPDRARVGWQVGPRYGRGIDFPIIYGRLDIDAEIPLRVS